LSIDNYLKSRAIDGPWRIEGCIAGGFAGAVVIPALAESATLFATLCSLARNPSDVLSQFLVLVVINHCEDAPPADKADNQATLALLAESVTSFPQLKLAWINAAAPEYELPIKGGGVGFARKIGLDLSLPWLDSHGGDPILVCLDADTLVRPDYLSALTRHFATNTCGAAVIPFQHQQGVSPQADAAITRYELFLRSYVLGLLLAGSPYAFHSVGSAMACRSSAYVKIGGMNSRSAGEDFYFLQQLARTVGVVQVSGTVVYPSQRASHRVPFGTGRSISRILEGGKGELLFYQTSCFRILGEWLALVSENSDAGHDLLLQRAEGIAVELSGYLELIKFRDIWPKLQKNNPVRVALLSAFNGWFDGLKTMKLIHHLSAVKYPRCEPEETLPDLMLWGGLKVDNGIEQQLDVLRRQQLGKDYGESGYCSDSG
jgi:hypothetical protein